MHEIPPIYIRPCSLFSLLLYAFCSVSETKSQLFHWFLLCIYLDDGYSSFILNLFLWFFIKFKYPLLLYRYQVQCCEKIFRNQYVLSHHLFVAHDGYFNICFETVFRSTDISICNTKFNCCRRREHNDDHMYCHGKSTTNIPVVQNFWS